MATKTNTIYANLSNFIQKCTHPNMRKVSHINSKDKNITYTYNNIVE